MSAPGSNREFQIGLAMAGAISAGAYSAGVFDFLIQALDAWETQRDKANSHHVCLKVMSGASAGAIVGALGTMAIARGLARTPFDNAVPGKQLYRCVLPRLYDAWVVKPSMVAANGEPDLLKTDDIKDGKSIVSILNSGMIDALKEGVLRDAWSAPPSLPYLSSTLDIYIMLTNVHGIPYKVTMNGGDYGMMSHHDRAHYRIKDLGTCTTASIFSDTDAKRELKAPALAGQPTTPPDWRILTDCAISSGAFPGGLAARELSAAYAEFSGRCWPIELWNSTSIVPDWAVLGPVADPFRFLTVDGGTINNEPLEYARFGLMENPPEPLARKGHQADRAVIMIDPFPEPPSVPGNGTLDRDVIKVMTSLVGVLKNHARFKPEEIILAASEDVYSRYLIAPHRTPPGSSKDETYAIACSLLGGFGGFLCERFRAHDYQLGRRNCQRFLEETFAVPGTNPVLGPDRTLALAKPGDPPAYRLIPLVGDAVAEVPYPVWPRLTAAEFDQLMLQIKTRTAAVLSTLVSVKISARWLRGVASVIAWINRSSVVDDLKLNILADLVRRDQIEGYSVPAFAGVANPPSPECVRKVAAELLEPAYDLRSVGGIATAAGLPASDVAMCLKLGLGLQGPFAVWQSSQKGDHGEALFTAASRKPSGFSQIWGIRQIGDWWSKPVTDIA